MEPFHFNSTIFFLLIILHASIIFISVNAVGQCLQSQSSALLQLKRGFSSGELGSWRPGTDCCMWDGVTCDEWRRVTSLQLSSRSITGTINPYLFNLTSLHTLSFADNYFDGIPIPEFGWERLPNLSSLDLSLGQFYGNVPAGIFSLSKLTSLDLSSNYNYGGLSLSSKPTLMLNLSRLTEIYLDGVDVSVYGDALCGALVNATPLLEVLSMNFCFLSGARCSSLAMLPLLSSISLGYNNLSTSILDSFLNLTSLSVLRAPGNGFKGLFPKQIFHLRNLMHLDIPLNMMLSGSLPDFLESSNLRSLVLFNTNFSGDLPDTIGNLKFLTNLDLSGCQFSGNLPDTIGNLKFLTYLDLSSCQFSGNLPDTIGNLKFLTNLYLSECQFSGNLPDTIGNFTSLTNLDLSGCRFSGNLPDTIGNLKFLRNLVLSGCQFSGNLPDTIGNLKFLRNLILSGCQFSGRIPPSIGNLSHIEFLDLSNNNFSGLVPFFMPFSRNYEPMRNGLTVSNAHICFDGKLCKLETLDLGNNSLSGSIFTSVFTLPALRFLQLQQNQFSGQLIEFSSALSLLVDIDLSSNKLYGQIPMSLFQISGLNLLSLASNNFSGDIEWNFTKDPINIKHLDLSNNRIQGKISSWLWNIRGLNLSYNLFTHLEEPPFNPFVNSSFIDLQANMLEGPIPDLPFIDVSLLDLSNNQFTSFTSSNISRLKSVQYFLLANNNLMGEIPLFICNMTTIDVLDLSNNKLYGYIPSCLLEKEMHLRVLNLKGNRLCGAIPNGLTSKCELQNINLRDNHLEGLLPISISNCQSLEILDLANNKLNDTFPIWSGNMSSLRILILRSNKFHGIVGCPLENHEIKIAFSMLHVFDISSNNFSGNICAEYFSNFKSMMAIGEDTIDSFGFESFGNYYDIGFLAIMNKGQLMTLQKIEKFVKAIDISNNFFEGEIPTTVGQLISLQVLNMSHNYLTGKIISQLGNLLQLETLDLSMNDLFGTIPQELIYLHFLEYLNLSYNMLAGRIPIGGQFSTFTNTSFEGNKGLCWLPCDAFVPGLNNATTSLDLGGTTLKNSNYIIIMAILFGVAFGVSMAVVIVIDVLCYDRVKNRQNRLHVHG